MQDKQRYSQILEKPLVSFILTYYNLPAKMLCECIDSILALALRPQEREIIIVDDGSSTSIVDSLSKYEKDIIYVRQANQGLSGARNTGIQMAKGYYLQFVDSDDLLVKAPYEHCLDIIRTSHPEMVVFDFTKTATDHKGWKDSSLQSGNYYMRHNNIKGTACCYLFQRAILGDLRFTPGIYHEDEEFTPLLLLRAEILCYTNAQAYFYRMREDSIVTKNNLRHCIKRLCDLKGVIKRLNYVADHRPIDDRTALQRRIAQLTMDYLYQIIIQTKSRHYLERKVSVLRSEGLFPLPDQDYTQKYTWFRRLMGYAVGRSVLMRVIPLMEKER